MSMVDSRHIQEKSIKKVQVIRARQSILRSSENLYTDTLLTLLLVQF